MPVYKIPKRAALNAQAILCFCSAAVPYGKPPSDMAQASSKPPHENASRAINMVREVNTMELFWTLIALGLLTEAVVETLKFIWDEKKRVFSWSALCAVAVGVAIAVASRTSLFTLLGIAPNMAPWLGYIVTGILISRGSNFLHDLWKRINAYGARK